MTKNKEPTTNEQILALIEEIKNLDVTIGKDAFTHPFATRAGFVVAQNQAIKRRPVAELELKNLLLKKAVKIILVDKEGSKTPLFTEQLAKQGMYSWSALSYYEILASRLPWKENEGLSAESFAILLEYLRSDSKKYGVYADIPVELPVNVSAPTYIDFINIVHDVVNKAFGERLAVAYQLTTLTKNVASEYEKDPKIVEAPLIFTIPAFTNEEAVVLSSLITPDKFSMIVDLTGEEVNKSVVMKAYQKMYQNLLKLGIITETKKQ